MTDVKQRKASLAERKSPRNTKLLVLKIFFSAPQLGTQSESNKAHGSDSALLGSGSIIPNTGCPVPFSFLLARGCGKLAGAKFRGNSIQEVAIGGITEPAEDDELIPDVALQQRCDEADS